MPDFIYPFAFGAVSVLAAEFVLISVYVFLDQRRTRKAGEAFAEMVTSDLKSEADRN